MARKSRVTDSQCTILVVDDQEEALLSVRKLLEREGHRVLTAESGDQALALFGEHEIHLVLVDYFMPRMTGEELIREIRRVDPFVQIILRTAYSGEKPPRQTLAELDIQGYHDKADGPEKLLLWVDVGLKAYRMVRGLRERERFQGELVSNVSHEFRTPLNIIGGYAGLLLEGAFGALPASAAQPLHSISEATTNLTELVSGFLNFAKLEARAVEIGQQLILVEELARELERLAELLLEGKDIKFTLDLQGAPTGVVTDSVKLRTILRNLVTNAVKFTTAGSIALRIALEGDRIRFTVQDTGPGIRAEDLAVIFEPFRQLNTTPSQKRSGVGLGLALSRKLACILGGDLQVESRPGMGSTFHLVLPVPVIGDGTICEGPPAHQVNVTRSATPG